MNDGYGACQRFVPVVIKRFHAGRATCRAAKSWGTELKGACSALKLPNDRVEEVLQVAGNSVEIGEQRKKGLLAGLKVALRSAPPEERIQTSEELASVRRLGRKLLFAHDEISHLKDEGQAIHFAWGRLVNQKAFHIIKEEIANITRKKPGGTEERDLGDILIVLATAPASDIEGIYVEKLFQECFEEEKRRGNSNFIFVNRNDPAFRNRCLLAATVAPLTSLYEPCGLTDVEAYWCGTLCAVHNVGGLVKGIRDEPGYTQIADKEPRGKAVAAGYDFFDNTHPAGEAAVFRNAYERLVKLFREDPRAFSALQFKALNLNEFTYDIPANRYVDLLQYVWLNQAWRWLKDHEPEPQAAVEEMIAYINDEADAAFVPQNCQAGSGAFAKLFKDVFRPPQESIGISFLDKDIELDRALLRAFTSTARGVAAKNPSDS